MTHPRQYGSCCTLTVDTSTAPDIEWPEEPDTV
ncbi:tail fiber assembly protein [Escherichia coli]